MKCCFMIMVETGLTETAGDVVLGLLVGGVGEDAGGFALLDDAAFVEASTTGWLTDGLKCFLTMLRL